MSTEIYPTDKGGDKPSDSSTFEKGVGRLHVTSFFGGVSRGRSLQFTPSYGSLCAQLTRAEVVELHAVLTQWLEEANMPAKKIPPTQQQIDALVRAADFVRRTGTKQTSEVVLVPGFEEPEAKYVRISVETFNELVDALNALPDRGIQP